MLGFNSTHDTDTSQMPVMVHSLQSAATFMLAQKIWQANGRTLMLDAATNKEFLRFVFTQPACTAWLQRDRGRQDTFELILLWSGQKAITEVYTVTNANTVLGDDKRANSLLSAILASPATVPLSH